MAPQARPLTTLGHHCKHPSPCVLDLSHVGGLIVCPSAGTRGLRSGQGSNKDRARGRGLPFRLPASGVALGPLGALRALTLPSARTLGGL